jgi:hypothetical protein
MTDHLSILQVKQLCVSALPDNELVAAAIHTDSCQSCNQRFIEELKRQRGSATPNFTLEPEFWFRNDHLDFDDLVALADNTFDEETLEIINIHLNACETCREDVRSFLAFREATAREMDISYSRPEYQTTHRNVEAAVWWQRLQSRRIYAVAAIVLVAIAVLIGVIALNSTSGSLEANRKDETNQGSERSPSITPSPAPGVVSSPANVDESARVAMLKDSGGDITIDKNGRITGLDGISENSRQYTARAAFSERIESAEVLKHLTGEQSGLRGNDDGPKGFRILYPVRRIVTEDRPLFRWQSLPGVSSYRVYVLDANGNQVGQSQELPSTQTQWKAPALTRGHVFSWVVTAIVDGKKIVSPSVSAPEIKFAVLSTADLQELTRLKKYKSHLALGVFYARAGLLDDAEREFQTLIKLNPDSELPRKLLQSVRSNRKAE